MEGTGGTLLVASVLVIAATAGCIGTDGTIEPSSNEDPGTDGPAGVHLDTTHDFTEEDATVTFTAPENATVSQISLYFDFWTGTEDQDTAGLCTTSEELVILIEDPSGQTYERLTYDGGLAFSTSGSTCGPANHDQWDPGIPIAPGEWTVTFSGDGYATGAVNVS